MLKAILKPRRLLQTDSPLQLNLGEGQNFSIRQMMEHTNTNIYHNILKKDHLYTISWSCNILPTEIVQFSGPLEIFVSDFLSMQLMLQNICYESKHQWIFHLNKPINPKDGPKSWLELYVKCNIIGPVLPVPAEKAVPVDHCRHNGLKCKVHEMIIGDTNILYTTIYYQYRIVR